MENWEREILDKVKDMAEDVQAAESLMPDAIEKKLKEAGEKKPKRRWKRTYTVGLAAACCLLVCGAVYAVRTFDRGWSGLSSHTAVADKADAGVRMAESYEEVYAYAKEYMDYRTDLMETASTTAAEEEVEMSAEVTDGAAESSSAKYSGYSETNVRQEGVDEADTVKTDGRYLYTLTESCRKIVIADTQGGLVKAGEIKLDEGEYIREFYVNDGKLIMVLSKDTYYDAQMDDVSYNYYQYGSTTVRTYDLQDVSQPAEIGEVTQSGDYTSSRIAGGYLYLFSQYYLYSDIQEDVPETYVPVVDDELMPKDDIFLPSGNMAEMYEIVTSVDLTRPDEVADSKAIFAKNGSPYVSGNNIYWYETEWEGDWGEDVTTIIRRISYQDGALYPAAQGEIPGYIHDSFSIDEYNGYLRVVTTDDSTNGVYVLNENMEIVGSVEGLAPDERVYSARFFGDMGYFVTFRETDPLFSVDLSDPQNPTVLGELKIPGFSEYLHFYGDNLLLGIGMAADEETGVTEGVKLSMFDISDGSDVKEKNVYVMENVYGTDASYDYKAVLIDKEKNLIGFSGYTQGGETYFVFSYDEENGFVCKMQEEVSGNSYMSTRGVYIGDVLYVVKGNIIEAYDLNDYNKVGDIIL